MGMTEARRRSMAREQGISWRSVEMALLSIFLPAPTRITRIKTG
jgi:hypothetical protein